MVGVNWDGIKPGKKEQGKHVTDNVLRQVEPWGPMSVYKEPPVSPRTFEQNELSNSRTSDLQRCDSLENVTGKPEVSGSDVVKDRPHIIQMPLHSSPPLTHPSSHTVKSEGQCVSLTLFWVFLQQNKMIWFRGGRGAGRVLILWSHMRLP